LPGDVFGFASAAIAASVIAARSVAVRPVVGTSRRKPADQQSVEGRWIIATAACYVAPFRSRVTDQGSQSIKSRSPSESGKSGHDATLVPLRLRSREQSGILDCAVRSVAGLAASLILFRAHLLAGELR